MLNNQIRILSLVFISLALGSCQKESAPNHRPAVQNQAVAQAPIDIQDLHIPDEELGMGCITEYQRTNNKDIKVIYLQTSSKDESSWVNFMQIDSKTERFISQNDDPKYNDDGSQYTLKLENDNYIVTLETAIGENLVELDTAPATGTIKIIRKSDQATATINFEGATAC